MYTSRGYNKTPIGVLYDGYKGEPIFRWPDNYSTRYNFILDSQCRVPIPNIEELAKELNL